MNEHDIFSDSSPVNPEIVQAKKDLLDLSEDDFHAKYKSTKKLFNSLIRSLEVLAETYEALQEPQPLEVDPEIADNVEYLMEDFTSLMEQMHMAAYWQGEAK